MLSTNFRGFAAVVYLRTIHDHRITTHLLTAKSKVAPLKRRSLLQLELCGAHLLSELIQFVTDKLSRHIRITNTVAWSDSTITIAWIRNKPYRLKIFVANRVTDIQECLPLKENPADPASRGLLPEELIVNMLWFQGPDWLHQCGDIGLQLVRQHPVINWTLLKRCE